MATAESTHGMRGGSDRQILSVEASQPPHRPVSRKFSHRQRSVKADEKQCPVIAGPHKACRSRGSLEAGDAVRVFCRSADKWVDGEVIERVEHNCVRTHTHVRVEYWDDERQCGKTLHVASAHLALPNIASDGEEMDPCGGLQLPLHNDDPLHGQDYDDTPSSQATILPPPSFFANIGTERYPKIEIDPPPRRPVKKSPLLVRDPPWTPATHQGSDDSPLTFAQLSPGSFGRRDFSPTSNSPGSFWGRQDSRPYQSGGTGGASSHSGSTRTPSIVSQQETLQASIMRGSNARAAPIPYQPRSVRLPATPDGGDDPFATRPHSTHSESSVLTRPRTLMVNRGPPSGPPTLPLDESFYGGRMALGGGYIATLDADSPLGATEVSL